MSGRGAIIMAEFPKSKDIVLLIGGNSSLNGKAATEEFLEHLDLVFSRLSLLSTTFHYFCCCKVTNFSRVSCFSREVRVFCRKNGSQFPRKLEEHPRALGSQREPRDGPENLGRRRPWRSISRTVI